MVDDPNIRPSGSFNIATEGVGTGFPISIATRGLLEPDVDVAVTDIIVAGDGSVEVRFNATGTGQLNTGGAVPVTHVLSGITFYFYPASGTIHVAGDTDYVITLSDRTEAEYHPSGLATITLTGAADVVSAPQIPAYVASGGVITDGTADIEIIHVPVTGDGTIVTDGAADIETTHVPSVGDGTIIVNGTATVVFDPFFVGKTPPGRGAPRRRPAQVTAHHYIWKTTFYKPTIKVEGHAVAEFRPADVLTTIMLDPYTSISVPLDITLKDVFAPKIKTRLIDFKGAFEILARTPKVHLCRATGNNHISGSAKATFISTMPAIYQDDEDFLLSLPFAYEGNMVSTSAYDVTLGEIYDDDDALLKLI